MSMMKMMPMILFLTISSSLSIWDMKSAIMMKFMLIQSTNLNFSSLKSINSILFTIMVSTVTTMIMIYSTFYMEFYNKKKFILLTMSFFASMLILAWSSDLSSTMMGWDGLGISSICLIMMYQNKTTMMNSILTMSFNRLGDIMMMYGIIMMMSFNDSMNFTNSTKSNTLSVMVLIMASMTKSAQFPLSTWLPAAMSAPTPISAMVHSSTLVTAGVLLMYKMYESMKNKNLLLILTITSSISMMTAGISTINVKELKKLIALSTMSHISMIMFMISLKMVNLSMIHMMAHAMFKTSIFMSAGSNFIYSHSNQMVNFLKKTNKNKSQMMMMKSSVMSLTGLPLTSSFYSKDKFMEMIMMKLPKTGEVLIMLMSSILTMMYSFKILEQMTEKMNSLKTFINKKNSFKMSMFMSILSIFGSKVSNIFVTENNISIISNTEMTMMTTLMIMSMMKSKMVKEKILTSLTNSMMMSKSLTSSKLNKMLKMTFYMNFSDLFMTNKNTWSINNKNMMNLFETKTLSLCLTLIMYYLTLMKMS